MTGTVTISNPNTRRQDSSIAITGLTMTGNFQASPNCGSMIAPGASCTVDFTFKPTAFGRADGTYTITDNSSTHGTSTVTLTGNLAITPLTVTPRRLNFGKETMNITSESQPITIHNNNPIAVTLTLSASGPDASDFHTSGNCSGSINPGSSCTENVTFDPSGPRNRRATLLISYSNRKQVVTMSGIGETGGPTPTGTTAPTATATSSIAATPTTTQSATPTMTVTASASVTATATSSSSPTMVPSPTATMTAASPTSTTSGTPTMTPGNGPTNTPTPTATLTIGLPTSLPTLPLGLATSVPAGSNAP
jgi:hypothetical protein